MYFANTGVRFNYLNILRFFILEIIHQLLILKIVLVLFLVPKNALRELPNIVCSRTP